MDNKFHSGLYLVSVLFVALWLHVLIFQSSFRHFYRFPAFYSLLYLHLFLRQLSISTYIAK